MLTVCQWRRTSRQFTLKHQYILYSLYHLPGAQVFAFLAVQAVFSCVRRPRLIQFCYRLQPISIIGYDSLPVYISCLPQHIAITIWTWSTIWWNRLNSPALYRHVIKQNTFCRYSMGGRIKRLFKKSIWCPPKTVGNKNEYALYWRRTVTG